MRGIDAVEGVDFFLKGVEGIAGFGFGSMVTGYLDVDYGAGGNSGWEENRWEFNLEEKGSWGLVRAPLDCVTLGGGNEPCVFHR